MEARLLHRGAEPPLQRRRASILRLLGLLGGVEGALLLVGLLAMMIASGSAMALPVYTGELVQAVVSDSSFPESCKASAVALAACRRDRLRVVLLILGVAFAVGGVALFLAYYCFELAGERLSQRLRSRLFAHYVQQAIAFFDEQSTGELMNRLASDCTAIQDTLTKRVGEGLHYVVLTAVGLAIMIHTSPELTAVALCTLPVIAAFAALYAITIMKLSERYQSALASASEIAQETLAAMRTVRSFASEERASSRYDASIAKSYLIGARRALATGAFVGLVSAVAQFALVVVLWVGCNRVVDGDLEFGTLSSFLLLAIYVIGALGGLADLFSALMSAVGASQRVFALLDTVPSSPLRGGVTLPGLKGCLRLENVAFSYPARPDAEVLVDVTLSVEPGRVLALCGASGGGKSSVIALLQRWYDPTAGRVLVDDVLLTALDPSWWRSRIALVAQEPVLFGGSVLENLLYGRPEATLEEVLEATRSANASFVEELPDALHTQVGERGVQLSGGQKQRIAIARALLVDPRVLLLDEATSALDSAAEALVQSALDQLAADRTTVVVAHRLSTIRGADCICVLRDGRVVEQGTHEELLARGGAYRDLVAHQASSISA